MAKKGKIKNGANKAKHNKLLHQKKAKLKLKKEANKNRLKALTAVINKENAQK